MELEEIVDDYYFEYPTLLDGEGIAPPEDVGGPPGFEEFQLVHESIVYSGDDTEFLQSTVGKPSYVPEKEELLCYTDEYYYEKTSHQEKLAKMLTKDFFGSSTLMVGKEIDEMI